MTVERPPPPETTAFAPLATQRLTLRPYRPEDAQALHRLINDWEVCRTLSAVPFPYSRAVADEWIASTAASLADRSAYHLVIVGSEDGQEMIVGGVGLRLVRGERGGERGTERGSAARSATLGYWVGRRFWGHGVASEAATRLARWALANLDLERIEAEVESGNAASIAVLRRVGLRPIGSGHAYFLARDAEHAVLRFEATREDLFGTTEAEPSTDGSKPLLLVAACALIDADGRVLLARRPEGKKMAGLWEFPGGKLDAGETPEAALIRELREELGIDVATACLAPFAFASHAYDTFHLLMPLFLCRRWHGTPMPREGQTLAWVRPEKLAEYPMPAADRPLVPLLRDFL